MKWLHERIKELRKYLGLTQAEFGEKIAMRQTGVAWLESGDRKITDRVITTICAVFGVDEIWLETGDGEMFRKMTRREKIAEFVSEALADESDSFKSDLILTLSALSDDGWRKLREVIRDFKKAEEKIRQDSE